MISEKEKEILRRLADDYLSCIRKRNNPDTVQAWKRMNDLDPVRPMVWIDEIPWNEMNVNEELTMLTSHEWAREWEWYLRKNRYICNHLPGDFFFSNRLPVAKEYIGGKFSLQVKEQTADSGEKGAVVSHQYFPQIETDNDVERLVRFEKPVYRRSLTKEKLEAARSVFKSNIPVELSGVRHIWYSPWDFLIRVWGVQEALIDLVSKPDLVHHALSAYRDGALAVLDAFVEEDLLSSGAGNTRVGSGGYGYTEKLPDSELDSPTTPERMWGCSNAQIFSNVSEEMHWEFALSYDIPWLSSWGLSYYGCCEPLDKKTDMIKRIPNLRKVSISPWANVKEAVQRLGDTVVYSVKPNPAVFAYSKWEPDSVRAELEAIVKTAREYDITVEIIMKDISTVSQKPERLWEWARISSECVHTL